MPRIWPNVKKPTFPEEIAASAAGEGPRTKKPRARRQGKKTPPAAPPVK